MNCEYCMPLNTCCLDDIGSNLLGDNEEINLAINSEGVLEFFLNIETNELNNYIDGYVTIERDISQKINYCPMCGRKLD